MEFDKIYVRHFYNRTYVAHLFGEPVKVVFPEESCKRIKKPGVTIMIGLRGNTAYGAVAVCSKKEQFSRKEGYKQALDHLNNFGSAAVTHNVPDPAKFYSQAKGVVYKIAKNLPFKDMPVEKGPEYKVIDGIPVVSFV